MDNVAMMKAQSTATIGRKETRFETHHCLAAATKTFMFWRQLLWIQDWYCN